MRSSTGYTHTPVTWCTQHVLGGGGEGRGEGDVELDRVVFMYKKVKSTRGKVPEDVSDTEGAGRRQTPQPAGISMVGGPHLDDDEGENSGVLQQQDCGKMKVLRTGLKS